jgi:chaperonin GroES
LQYNDLTGTSIALTSYIYIFLLNICSSEKGDTKMAVAAKMTVQPLADRVLVRRIESTEEKSDGGIIIPDTAKEKPQEAEVVAVGPGKKNKDGDVVALDVKKGDKVLISKYGGTDVKINGEEHLIVREDDILAIVK